MPYFPDHQALFIHIPKCAGKSIEAAMLPPGLDGTAGKRPLLNRAARMLEKATHSQIPARYLLGTYDVALAAQHLTYAEIELLGLLPREVLDNALKFAVVRHPYGRAISSVMHFRHRFADRYRLSERPDRAEVERAIAAWLEIEPPDHNVRAHRRRQVDYLRGPDGTMRVERILRLESLKEDFASLCADLSLPAAALPWVDRSGSKRDRNELLTARSRQMVREAFAADFDILQYAP